MNGRSSEATVADLWREYGRTRAERPRNALAEHYLPLARKVAEVVRLRLPRTVDLDDLVSDACVGLVTAIERFDPDRGVRFETFSSRRIRGAVMDGLREMDPASRLTRKRDAWLYRARVGARQRLGREPTEHELARAMRLTDAEFATLKRGTAGASVPKSLSRKRFDTDGGRDVCEVHLMGDRRVPLPGVAAEDRDAFDRMVRCLPRDQRFILTLYYGPARLKMREIGRALGFSESRVSQLHDNAIRTLKAELTAPDAPRREAAAAVA